MRGLGIVRALGLVLLVGAAVAQAQDKPVLQTRPADAPPPSTISVNAQLVVLTAVVHDKKGELVNNLTKDNFVLKAAGDAQTIKYFDHDTDVPLTLGLLVDVSRSQRDKLPEEQKGAQAFVDKSLLPASGKREADKAFVVQFAKPIELLQDVTESRQRLQKALGELGSESPTFRTTDTGDSTDSEGRRVRGGGTSLYDAIYLSADEVMGKQKGRKALVVLTDGVDVGSKETLTEALEAAQRADTVIYAVYYKGAEQQNRNNNGFPGQRRGGGGYPGGGYPGGGYPGGGYPGGGYPGGGGGYPGGGGGGGNNPNGGGNTPGGPSRKPNIDGRQVLARLCGETGGELFEVSKKLPVEEIFAKIGDDLRSQYRLGFTPTEAAAKYGYHQIDLDLAGDLDKKDVVATRDGYYAGGKD